jgi:aryl-alcohol dehydrogenase-like predicted oxidoreductase
MAAENIKKNVHIAQSVQNMANQKGVTAAQLAIAWVLNKSQDVLR